MQASRKTEIFQTSDINTGMRRMNKYIHDLSREKTSLHPFMSIEGDAKGPMALFDKSRVRSSWCHGLPDCAVIGLCGWDEITHGLKRLQCIPLYMLVSDITSVVLHSSATCCNGGK